MTMFSHDTIDFLAALRANNSRAWFEGNRGAYHDAVRDAARDFAETLSSLLEMHGHGPVTPKIFRINRDLRFSKDKTPYNAHVHIAFRPADAGPDGPAWMVGLEPGKLTLGAGIMQFAPSQLDAWRESVAGPAGAQLQRDLDNLRKRGCSLSDPDLVRVPKPYEKDHPRADLLRRKGLVVWWHTDDTHMAFGPEGPARCQEKLQTFAAVMVWLGQTLQAGRVPS
ncbi:uncharacterized protein (TIGR02453 family) [Yoonia sediminilitoris]|uniref:Uncharacterized protein (TIGR02453 family) n=2 Tax=Yoonia sediminilitoris TaxID=1286148 RepID=A0A2T6K5A2_9RHOB|nr:uncharacterized protein (TIGR02453 family) [Yoonia sediminilitoris]RCW89562.1 uncharacterized protein (TIGR02453 family) [Yoonia sediminilitoris]